jgi:hypothetical protein
MFINFLCWLFFLIDKLFSRLSAVEADVCQVSRPSGLQDFIPTAYVRNMTTCRVTGMLGWMWAESEMLRAAWRGFGRRTTAFWALHSLPGRPTPSSCTAAALGPASARGEAQNWAVNCGQKWMGASRLERAEPHGGSPGWQLYLTAHWTYRWGPAWDWKGARTCGGSTPGSRWAAESEWGHVTGARWAPRAVHRDRWLHYMLLAQLEPTWTPSRPPARQDYTGCWVAELNCL